MTKKILSLLIFFAFTSLFSQTEADKFVDELMSKMTLDEKIGQMNQYTGDFWATGIPLIDEKKEEQIVNGQVGSMLNVVGYKNTREAQEMAMRSRLKIPLLFGLDVIHGFRTTFPIPLAETATWDLNLIKKSARIAAVEASAYGIHWTFAPMVDIARDPRWGRVMEGAGEDVFLGSKVAKARVLGFQTEKLGSTDAIMACAKHFAAYGAAEGGRDYNTVDMSLRRLHEVYLPPFKAAVEAGVATLMNSFNDINGIPATGSAYIQRDILKNQWSFKGFVVSDWGSIGEMIAHGYAKDNHDAAMKAIIAGSDMDMESRSYKDHLKQLVESKVIDIILINEAVRRILLKKYEMGLFEDPFRFCNAEREKKQENNPEHRAFAREIGKKSIVLLKNEKQVLPLSKSTKNIAFIGPFAKATIDNHGFWSVAFPDDSLRIVSQYDGIKQALDKNSNLYYAKGCNIDDQDKSGFEEALKIAAKSDVVILSMGEAHNMSGEAKSRHNIEFPGVQEELIKEISKTGKPIVLLINAGRPLIFNWAADNVPAILYTWWLGTEAGNSIADVVFGNYNPAGKLPMTFPRSVGQIPFYYNHFNTGRPSINGETLYKSTYIDLPNAPKYPFGYGLSYTHFKIDHLQLSSDKMSKTNPITISVDVTNSGDFDGEEVVQLYIRDLVGSVVRPVKELKGFEKIFLKKGETKKVTFTMGVDDLRFYNDKLEYIYEQGEFEVFVGNSSENVIQSKFELM